MKHLATTMALAVAITLGASSNAEAWNVFLCSNNGNLAYGVQGPVPRWYLIESGGASAAFWDVAIDTTAKMAVLGGVYDRFPSISAGDVAHGVGAGIWEIVLNPHDSGPLYQSGSSYSAGYAARVYRSCNSGGGVIGTTVYLDESLSFAHLAETDEPTSLRGVLSHELGHVLGMEHEDDVISTMNTNTPTPKHGSYDRNGATSGYGNEGLWANDIKFALTYHDDSTASRRDPAASPWFYDPATAKTALIYPPGGTTTSRCHGLEASVTYTTANLGTLDTGDVPVRIVLSTNTTITRSDFLARDTLTSRSVGSSSEVTKTFIVPDIGQGTYHVGIVLDQADTLTETSEYNNATLTGLRIKINSWCFL